MKLILNKKFLKYFLISFFSVLGIFILQFLGRYADEIFNKGFPIGYVLKFILIASITLIKNSLPYGILIATIFSYRYYLNRQRISFKKELLNGSAAIFAIVILFFCFSNWISPKSNLTMGAMLWEIRSTEAGEEIEKVNKDLFVGINSMMTLKDLNSKIDSFNLEISALVKQCDTIISALPDSIAKRNYDALYLSKYGVTYIAGMDKNISIDEIRFLKRDLGSIHMKLKMSTQEKQKFTQERAERIILPILILFLFIIGSSYGFIYNDQKPFLLVILGMYTTVFFIKLEYYISQNLIGNSTGTTISMIIIIGATLVFLIKAIRKEIITQPNKK